MSNAQFALFFVALLIGYVLVHLRLIRFEEHLRKLAGIRALDDRLQAIDERVRKLSEKVGGSASVTGLERVSEQLDRLHEDLEVLREATGEVRHAVVQIPSVAPAAPPRHTGEGHEERSLAAASSEPPSTRIVALIETRLLQLGYRNLRLLGDLDGVQMTDEIEVTVEAEKNGMPCKGRIVMRNGSVHDLHMQSVVQAFP